MTRSAPPGPRRTDPDVPGVVGTALGAMPGTDVVESVTLLRGELGAPHISFLPVLPARGAAADPVARTAAVLDDLYADRQPHGLRVSGVHHQGPIPVVQHPEVIVLEGRQRD